MSEARKGEQEKVSGVFYSFHLRQELSRSFLRNVDKGPSLLTASEHILTVRAHSA